jgi:hypothetical protein
MEALAALGIASAVVQFIQFTSSLISGTKDVLRSENGATMDDLELEQIYNHLSQLCERLTVVEEPVERSQVETLPFPTPHSTTGSEMAVIRGIASKCQSDCRNILGIVETLTVQGGKQRLWRAAKSSVKRSLKKAKIASLQESIHKSQSVLSLHLQKILRYCAICFRKHDRS